MYTKISLSHKPLSVWSEIGTWRGFDLLYCVFEWMLKLLYWMCSSENLDTWSCGGWGVFIALNHQGSRWGGCWRWAHRTVQCLVRRHVTQPLGFWSSWPLAPLSSCGTGQSGGVPDSLVPLSHYSDFCYVLCCTVHAVRVGRCVELAVAPLAHRTVRWIIEECACDFPRMASWPLYGPGALDTIRWHTGQSGASDHSTLSSLLRFNLVCNLNLLLVCVEPYAPVIHEF
jgi:hypothetical protein